MAKPEKKIADAPADGAVTGVEMMLIKVIRPFKSYSPGDITGFASDKAQALIDGGVAEPYSPDDKPAEE